MAFYLKSGEDVDAGVKRIITEQIDKAVAEIDDQELDQHVAVHQVRKRCKKIRGVLRLVRPALGDNYRPHNARFRNAARTLSYVRDAEAIVGTLDALQAAFREPLEEGAFAHVRETLTRRRRNIAEDEVGLAKRLARFRQEMCDARQRLEDSSLAAEGFDAIEPGLLKTYRRGRRAMSRALAVPTVANFHEWRKRAKYFRYHTRLLGELWKPVMEVMLEEAIALSDHLGDDHDLAVLRDTLLKTPDDFGDHRALQALLGLMDRRSAELRANARTLGTRVFAEKPGALGTRYRRYWEAWQEADARVPSPLSLEPAVLTVA